MHHKYVTATDTSSYHLTFATSTRKWSMTFQRAPVVPFRWVHVTITWSVDWGLSYYEDGRLVQTQLKTKVAGDGNNDDKVTIGKAPSIDILYNLLTLQMSDLTFRYGHLTSEAVKENVHLSGAVISQFRRSSIPGGTPYNGVYDEAPPERGNHFQASGI